MEIIEVEREAGLIEGEGDERKMMTVEVDEKYNKESEKKKRNVEN